MALAEATITYDLSDMVGADFNPSYVQVWVTTNVPGGAIADTDGAAVRIGDGVGSLDSDGTGALNVWVPGDGSNPASWQTYIHVSYSPRRDGWQPVQRTFGPFTITEDTDLAYLVAEQEVPPTYLSQVTAELQTYVDAASTFADDSQASADASEQARLAAEALILSDLGTTDGQTRALIENPVSQTTTALTTTIVAAADKRSYSVLDHGAKGDGTTNDLSAINDLIASVSAAGGGNVLVPSTPAGYKLGGQIVWLPGVNLIGNRTKLTISGNSNFIRGASTVATTKAVITADTTIATTALTVDSSSSFAVGDDVWVQIGQAAYDAGEPDFWFFAKVAAIPNATHLTLDRPVCYALTVGAVANTSHRAVYKVTQFLEGVTASGFKFNNPATGTSDAEFGLSLYVARNLVVDQITALNPGAGAIGGQFVDGLAIPSVGVIRSIRQNGHSAKGRAINFGESRGIQVGIADLRDCDAGYVLAEGGAEIQIDNLVVHNKELRADGTTRSETIAQTLGVGSKIRIGQYHHIGHPGTDLFGGDVKIDSARFDTSTTSPVLAQAGYVRRELTMRGSTYDEVRRYSAQKVLAANTSSQTVNLPSGILRRVKVHVTSTTGITDLRISNKTTNGSSLQDLLVAGQTVDLSLSRGSTAINDGATSPNRYEGKQLLIATDATLPGGTVLSVEVEYWTAPSGDDQSAAQIAVPYVPVRAGEVIGRTALSSSATYTTTSTTFADANTANAKVTFVAPASGKVQVMVSGLMEVGTNTALDANLRLSSADVAGTAGRLAYNNGTGSMQVTFCRPFNLTGLTAGTTYTYQLGIARATGSSTASIYVGGAAGDLTLWAIAAP